MKKRNRRRTDQEWMDLIQDCRTSGLTDRQWCEENHISLSNFYKRIRKLRENAYEVPERTGSVQEGRNEVVEITASFPEDINRPAPQISAADTAVRLVFKGIPVEITNAASMDAVFHTISVLEKLC